VGAAVACRLLLQLQPELLLQLQLAADAAAWAVSQHVLRQQQAAAWLLQQRVHCSELHGARPGVAQPDGACHDNSTACGHARDVGVHMQLAAGCAARGIDAEAAGRRGCADTPRVPPRGQRDKAVQADGDVVCCDVVCCCQCSRRAWRLQQQQEHKAQQQHCPAVRSDGSAGRGGSTHSTHDTRAARSAACGVCHEFSTSFLHSFT
jgi:hypothetical protein